MACALSFHRIVGSFIVIDVLNVSETGDGWLYSVLWVEAVSNDATMEEESMLASWPRA